MNINIEDYLHKIDLALKYKTQKDIKMIYIMIFLVIFAFSYQFFWENSENNFTKKVDQIDSIESKINADFLYLQYNPEIKITKLKSEIKKEETELLIYKDNNAYIKNRIEAISSLIYDESSWGEYLHSISKNANDNNVKIIDFTNKYASKNQSFGHILDITLKITANYKDTLKFINSLEQSELVVDIHDLNIYVDNTLNTQMKISVWGITY